MGRKERKRGEEQGEGKILVALILFTLFTLEGEHYWGWA